MRVKKKKITTEKYDENENLISKEVKIIEKEFEEESNDNLEPYIWRKDPTKPYDPLNDPVTVTWSKFH